MVFGDFNMNLLNISIDNSSASFFNLMSTFSLIPTITKPTRINVQRKTLIHNIFTSMPNNVSSGNLFCSLSDHLANFLIHGDVLENIQTEVDKCISFRIINDVTLAKLYNSLAVHDFSAVTECQNVDSAIIMLSDVIMHHFNLFCPIKHKTISSKSKLKPWISDDIVRCIKLRQSFNMLCRQGRFDECKSSIKKTWQLINDEIKPGRSQNLHTIARIVDWNSEFTEHYDIAEKLNVYFSSVGEMISDSCPNVNSDFREWLRGSYCDSFVYREITTHDIYKIVNSLKNKPCHINLVPVRVLKFISEIISPILCVLVNSSVLSGVFPESLKLARIVPLFKGGDPSSMKNYRPISILSSMSKIFEKVMHMQL